MISEGGERIACPTRDFNAVFLLIHIYRHFFDEGIGLRQLMDYYYCIIRDGDNRYVVNLLKSSHYLPSDMVQPYQTNSAIGCYESDSRAM